MHPLAAARLLPVAAGAAVLALTLTACGDDGPGGDDGIAADAPKDASAEAFCDAYLTGGVLEGGNTSVDSLHDYAENLAKVGTPSSISGDAREGFEIWLDIIADTDDGGLDVRGGNFSDVGSDEATKVAAFVSSAAIGECFANAPVPTDIPTDIPTDGLPSDLPTDIPEIPTDIPT